MTRIRKMKAVVCCTGESRIRPDRAELANVLKKDQNSAASEKLLAAFPEGIRACAYGCLGGGSCEQVCRCHAIHISENGTARVDEEKCAGCGRCVKACPQHLIRLFPSEDSIRVLCSGRDPGKTAEKQPARYAGHPVSDAVYVRKTVRQERSTWWITARRSTQAGVFPAECVQ